jgi:predicted lipid-binding transport protein (Tim44 family)
MLSLLQKIIPVFAIFITVFMIEGGVMADYAEARSKFGGRSFSRPTPRKAPASQQSQQTTQNKSGFSKGLAGGLLGGAIGGLLFGSLFGAGGTGMGLLPLLLLAGVAFFLYRKMVNRAKANYSSGYGGAAPAGGVFGGAGGPMSFENEEQPEGVYGDGLGQLRKSDPQFDDAHFVEVASDVFFQVQAGWMRRDLDSYRHLLGDKLAAEYEEHFAELKSRGHINKLESIAIRKVELVDAGSDGKEDFATVLFTANLLDYTVDEKTNELVDGSMTSPIKFEEQWTWARPVGTQDWKLEGLSVVNG